MACPRRRPTWRSPAPRPTRRATARWKTCRSCSTRPSRSATRSSSTRSAAIRNAKARARTSSVTRIRPPTFQKSSRTATSRCWRRTTRTCRWRSAGAARSPPTGTGICPSSTARTISTTISRTRSTSRSATASPTRFNVGEYEFSQLTARFDMTRPFEVGGFANPVNLAWGVEYREDGYKTRAGDPESYEAGPVIGAPIGTQAGSGLKPEETVDVDRDAVGAYIDLESDITDRFQAGVAARVEDYSDFGSSVDGKLSGRFELTDSLAVRGTVGTGFRAPSLTQAFFRGSTTSFGELGQLENVLNLPTDDPIAVAARRERSRCRGVRQLQPRLRIHAGRTIPSHGRLLPRRNRRPDHALGAHRRARGHAVHRGPARDRGRARRALSSRTRSIRGRMASTSSPITRSTSGRGACCFRRHTTIATPR